VPPSEAFSYIHFRRAMLTPTGTFHTHIKQDENGNEIARYDVTTSESYININDSFIEAWDLATAIKEKYEVSLDKSINDGGKFDKPLLYFMVIVKKNPIEKKKIHIKIGISDTPLSNKKYEAVDYWSYDYRKNKLHLIWSVPHKTAMKLYLKDPERYDKDLVRWTREFIAQEGLDLKALERKKIKIL